MVSTAQHLTDLAVELSRRGHSVTVLTSDRGYDDPSIRFPKREQWNGITIFRIPSLSWGKNRKWKRAVNFSSFLFICALRLLFLRRFDTVVALTSPPLISFLAALYVRLKGGRFCCWIMDLNPDEAIAAGWLSSESLTARLLSRMMRYSLRRADHTVVLDRFMKERIRARGLNGSKISIVSPWAHSDVVSYSKAGRERFRVEHDFDQKFVVMYSGNHSPCHPLDTLTAAALDLRDRNDVAFCFIGGGSEHVKVKAFAERLKLTNITSLPYQPLSKLSESLSAADLHVVVMGDSFVGIVHPCKVYNILAVGSPILYIGPDDSHITELRHDIDGNQLLIAKHGETSQVVEHILNSLEGGRDLSESPLSAPIEEFSSRRSYSAKIGDSSPHSREVLLPQLCAILESSAESTKSAQAPIGGESILSITNDPGS